MVCHPDSFLRQHLRLGRFDQVSRSPGHESLWDVRHSPWSYRHKCENGQQEQKCAVQGLDFRILLWIPRSRVSQQIVEQYGRELLSLLDYRHAIVLISNPTTDR